MSGYLKTFMAVYGKKKKNPKQTLPLPKQTTLSFVVSERCGEGTYSESAKSEAHCDVRGGGSGEEASASRRE